MLTVRPCPMARTNMRCRDTAQCCCLKWMVCNCPSIMAHIKESFFSVHAVVGNNSPDIAPHTGAPAITVPMSFTIAGVASSILCLSLRNPNIAGPTCMCQLLGSQLDSRVCLPGLPLGLQFVSRPWDEPTLIRLASAYEQATHHRRPPLDFPECAVSVVPGDAPDESSAEVTSG